MEIEEKVESRFYELRGQITEFKESQAAILERRLQVASAECTELRAYCQQLHGEIEVL